ncbi:hypothetical protein VTO73DRAFT_10431 [Trametes versicolor]
MSNLFVHKVNIDMLSSAVPQGVIHAQNITQRRLMHIEQAVEDISDLFLRVYLVLGAVPPEGATFITEEVSSASWDEYYQRFLRIAARSLRNLKDAVAVMDGWQISDEQERWAGYLARRAEHVDSNSNIADETDLAFCNEIVGMWDAIMSIRHATLQTLNASGSRDLKEF